MLLLSEAIGMILMTAWYQFVDRSWFSLQLIMFLSALICLIYILKYIPESPKWYYSQERFDESRQQLIYVAKFNKIEENKVNDMKSLIFDLEFIRKIEF